MIGRVRYSPVVLAVVVFATAAWKLMAQAPPPPTQAAPPRVVAQPLPVTSGNTVFLEPQAQRFHFTIDPKTPLKELLPVPPKTRTSARPVSGDDLSQIPEVEFQAPLPKEQPAISGAKQLTAHQIAKVNFLNAKKTDGFLEALRGERADLAGLPFAMGDACRTKGDRSKQFAEEVARVRQVLSPRSQTLFVGNNNFVVSLPAAAAPAATPAPEPSRAPVAPPPVPAPPPVAPSTAQAVDLAFVEGGEQTSALKFWESYRTACDKADKNLSRLDRTQQEHVTCARIAALMQVLAPEPPSFRQGLVKYLSGVAHAEATRALARLAIFSTEEEVRQSAVEALKVRRERDYTDVLVQGLRYPLPAVARRAADAIVKLERTDLIARLVDALDEPDPRAPVTQEADGKTVTVVRELVRVNHHRNCLLCHAPGNTDTVSPDTLTAGVPVPNEPLSQPFEGYNNSSPDLLVRIDVTYLRQDFSVRQPVADANPWPEMQRFDFLVRTRELTEAEVAAYREKFAKPEPGRPSPYQKAALAALRELTGKDTEPTAAGWRRLLDLPAKQRTATP